MVPKFNPPRAGFFVPEIIRKSRIMSDKPVIADLIKGTTLTTGDETNPFVFESAAAAGFLNPNTLEDEEVYHYYIKLGSDFEQGEGRYDSASNHITRDKLLASSTGSFITWGAGTKDIGIVATSSQLSRFLRQTLRKPVGQAYFVVGTGQSNFNNGGVFLNLNTALAGYGVDNRVVRNVYDWSCPSFITEQDYDPENADWTIVDLDEKKADETWPWPGTTSTNYPTTNPAGPIVGFAQRVADNRIGHIGMAFAIALQQLTGQKVYTCFVAANSTAIGDLDNGWVYYDEAGYDNNCGGRLSKMIKNALASIELQAEGITAPDIQLWCQGEADITTKTPLNYAALLRDFIQDCRNPGRWGWSAPGTPWILFDMPWEYKEQKNVTEWNGLQLAAQMSGDHVYFMANDAESFPTRDTVHWWGNTCCDIGQNAAEMLFSGMLAAKNPPGLPYKLTRESYDNVIPANRVADSDGDPGASNFSDSLTGNVLRISELLPDILNTGWGYLLQRINRDQGHTYLVFEEVATPANRIVYTVSHIPKYADGSWQYHIVEYDTRVYIKAGVVSGDAPNLGAYTFGYYQTHNGTTGAGINPKKLWDGVRGAPYLETLSTDYTVPEPTSYPTGNTSVDVYERGPIYADSNSEIFRIAGVYPFIDDANNGGVNLVYSPNVRFNTTVDVNVGDKFFVCVEVAIRDTDTDDIWLGTVRGVFERIASTPYFLSMGVAATDEHLDQMGGDLTVTLSAFNNYRLSVTTSAGGSGRDLDIEAHGFVKKLLNTP